MRQKKIKNVDEKMVLFSEPLIDCPSALKGRWREAFGGIGAAPGDGAVAPGGGAARGRGECDARAEDGGGAPPRSGRPLRLEIGCGKGRFLKASALKDPGSLYLGFEGQQSVLYRALQRAYTDPDVRLRDLNEVALALVGLYDGDCADGRPGDAGGGKGGGTRDGGGAAGHADVAAGDGGAAAPPDNLRFCAEYILDMCDYFAGGEIDGVFLNFSDPWPKARQEKRRLTSPGYLNGYRDALADGGFLRFKTDSADFFAYSRARIEEAPGFEITALTSDLHASEYADDNEMTEYELRFLNLNKKIRYLEARKLPRLREV
jgi:tRNA (guanine-N7-)-methyltransferase